MILSVVKKKKDLMSVSTTKKNIHYQIPDKYYLLKTKFIYKTRRHALVEVEFGKYETNFWKVEDEVKDDYDCDYFLNLDNTELGNHLFKSTLSVDQRDEYENFWKVFDEDDIIALFRKLETKLESKLEKRSKKMKKWELENQDEEDDCFNIFVIILFLVIVAPLHPFFW